MKLRNAVCIGLVLGAAAAVISFGVKSRQDSRALVAAAARRLHLAEIGEAYACGYLAGQIATLKRAGTAMAMPQESSGCANVRATAAAANGFER